MRGWDLRSEVLFSYVNCEQRVDSWRQTIHAQMRDLRDLGDCHRAVRSRHDTVGAAHCGDVALQQMRANAAELVAQHAAGASHRTP